MLWNVPKTSALFEHEYEKDLADSDWKRVAGDVEQCLRNFYSSETFTMLKELPQQNWLEVENFSFFDLDLNPKKANDFKCLKMLNDDLK